MSACYHSHPILTSSFQASLMLLRLVGPCVGIYSFIHIYSPALCLVLGMLVGAKANAILCSCYGLIGKERLKWLDRSTWVATLVDATKEGTHDDPRDRTTPTRSDFCWEETLEVRWEGRKELTIHSWTREPRKKAIMTQKDPYIQPIPSGMTHVKYKGWARYSGGTWHCLRELGKTSLRSVNQTRSGLMSRNYVKERKGKDIPWETAEGLGNVETLEGVWAAGRGQGTDRVTVWMVFQVIVTSYTQGQSF